MNMLYQAFNALFKSSKILPEASLPTFRELQSHTEVKGLSLKKTIFHWHEHIHRSTPHVCGYLDS